MPSAPAPEPFQDLSREGEDSAEPRLGCWRSILLPTGLRPVLKLLDLYPPVPVASTKKLELNQTRSSKDQR